MLDVVTNSTPAENSLPTETNWISQLAKAWIKIEFGVVFCDRSVRSLLQRLGLRYTMPTYRLAKADPEKRGCLENDSRF